MPYLHRPDPARTRLTRAAALLAGLLAVSGLSVPATAATLEVGPGKTYAMPSDAAAVAKDGDHILIAAGEYFDCAFWRADNLTIEGAGMDATAVSEKSCGGKAIFVVDGNNITIRNLTLSKSRVPDFNGAGIRAEGGNLTVEHVRFLNNQDGILSSSIPTANIIVTDSEFIRNGTCQGGGGCAHGIYIGAVALLHIERSKFFETREGHHIKSRAARTEVIDCDIADGAKGTASYSIDVPNGGAVLARGNHIQKGPNSENHTAALMIGAEGVTQHTPEILVENNTLLVEGTYTSYLVDNITATEAVLRGNILKGNAKALLGDGTVE